MTTKAEARKIARQRVAQMSVEDREWASGCIVDALSGLDAFRKAKSLFVYLATDIEPDTEEIIGLALMLERTVSVPKVRGDKMDAVTITPYTNFFRNKWGILEPKKGQLAYDIEAAVIPMAAFDGLKRVGRGGGYYDRFLAERDLIKIGVAFDCQQVQGTEVCDHDVAMDVVVTEKRVITREGETANIYGE